MLLELLALGSIMTIYNKHFIRFVLAISACSAIFGVFKFIQGDILNGLVMMVLASHLSATAKITSLQKKINEIKEEQEKVDNVHL